MITVRQHGVSERDHAELIRQEETLLAEFGLSKPIAI